MQATANIKCVKRATDYGTFWLSNATKQRILDHVRSLELTTFKSASIGGEQEQGFEQAFSSLAYAYLKDKSPRLLDFLVGFQLVDRNEDNTKAVAIFGFKVGDQWLYAPVFFLNGDLKGHELLYIKNEDMFVPMKENWVNDIISKKPHELGEGSDQNTWQLGGLQPNLSRLSKTPGTKWGSDEGQLPIHFDAWSHGFLPLLGAFATKQASALYDGVRGDLNFQAIVADPTKAALAPFNQKFDLRNSLSSDFRLLKLAYDSAYQKYPLLKSGFDKFYGTNFFAETAAKIKIAADDLVTKARTKPTEKKASATRSKPGDISLFPATVPADPNKGLYVYAADDEVNKVDNDVPITENKPELTETERERLLKDHVLIKDERDPHAKSMVYNTQVKTELMNPGDTGLYEVLEKPGSFDQMIVISNPQSGRGREDFCLVIRKGSTKNWKNTHRTNLWVKSCDCPVPADWKKYVEGLDGTDSLKKGGTYVAIHQNGSGTCPFTVREDYGDGVYKVEWKDSCRYGDDRVAGLPKIERPQDWSIGYSSWDAKVYVNKRKGTGLKSINGELSIPEDYKIIKISDPPKPKKKDDPNSIMGCCPVSLDGDGDGDDSSKNSPIQPGNLIDVQTFLHKSASTLSVRDIGANSFYIKSKRGDSTRTKIAALIHLVRDHGMREEDARFVLDAAVKAPGHVKSAAEFFIKYAFPLQPGPNAPAIPEPWMGSEQTGPGAVNAIYPQEEHLPIDSLSSQLTDPSVYDPFYQPDQNAMGVAQQASASGQKEVFDTAMIGGMLKSVRQDSLVDRYLGDLMKALDKLGRILFMFYWHQEEFEDRYGKQDIPELEDTLRNSFEMLGDLVLFLKEKTVKGMHGLSMSSGASNTNSPGEPDITEASRN